jgi:hypothetical protein
MKSGSPLSLAGVFLLSAFFLPSCDSEKKREKPPLSSEDKAAASVDIPILPVKPGDAWIYETRLEIPPDVTSPGAAAVDTKHRRTRTYLGKISPAGGLPETDCFEVVVQGSPNEREFVEIYEDRILMRGSLIMRPETTQPMWLATPVPFVFAGMKPGTDFAEIKTAEGGLSRKTQVIAREEITVPAGNFRCVRLLTTGNDGDVELRRTIWFAPGKGIIREEKTRYHHEVLIFRETQQLTELKKAP